MENKNEQVEQETMKTNKNLLTSSKSEEPMGPTTTGQGKASRVIGSFTGMGVVGFCLELDSC